MLNLTLTVVALYVHGSFAGIPSAYHRVAQEQGIPAVVLFSVCMEESRRAIYGRSLPWPWTLNVEGKALYFETQNDAKLKLMQSLIEGRSRIAVGLCQIYIPAHSHMFASPTDILDPKINLRYAANLLAGEYIWTKRNASASWWVAAGRYHAPNNTQYARAYRRRVFAHCEKVSNQCASLGEV